MFCIGDMVLIETPHQSIEGIIVKGVSIESNEESTKADEPIDIDSDFTIRCFETSEKIMIQGWNVETTLLDDETT